MAQEGSACQEFGRREVLSDPDDLPHRIHRIEFQNIAAYGLVQRHRPERLSYVYDLHIKNVCAYFQDRPNDLLIMNILQGDGWMCCARSSGNRHRNLRFPISVVGTRPADRKGITERTESMARPKLIFLQRLQFAVRRGMAHLGMPVEFTPLEGHHRKKNFTKDLIRHQQQHGLAELFAIKVEQVERFVEESGALPESGQCWHRPGRFDGVGTPMGEFDRKTLYAAVRARSRNIVVETGTAAGASSTFVLAALEKNGRGYMHSIDSFGTRPRTSGS